MLQLSFEFESRVLMRLRLSSVLMRFLFLVLEQWFPSLRLLLGAEILGGTGWPENWNQWMQMEGVPLHLVLKPDHFPAVQGGQEVKFLFGTLVQSSSSVRHPVKIEYFQCKTGSLLFLMVWRCHESSLLKNFTIHVSPILVLLDALLKLNMSILKTRILAILIDMGGFMEGLHFKISLSMTTPISCDGPIQDDTDLYIKLLAKIISFAYLFNI